MGEVGHVLFRCMKRYCRRIKGRLLFLMIGLTTVSVAVWILNNSDTDINIDRKQQLEIITPQTHVTDILHGNPKTFEKKVNHDPLLSHHQDEKPIIIRWHPLGLNKDDNITCGMLNCHVTSNREVRHQNEVLGIMFDATHFGTGGLPLPRKPGHLWSVSHNESPRNNDWLFCAKDAMNLFNLTSTFKRESHYPVPTIWLRNESDLTSMEFVVSVDKKNQLRREGLAPVVFVHSDCHVPSDRSHYMRLLQRHIKVDSYGPCEHNKDFPKGNMSGIGKLLSRDFYKLIAKYKFVFAFENSVCDDYITEKFWRSLQLGVVPITFGSPKIQDFAPSDHCIIDIRDFRSVKEVAQYISFLDTHDEEYSKYLDFKQSGITNPKLKSHLKERDFGNEKTHTFLPTWRGFACFICMKLHKLRNQIRSGTAVEQWQGKHEHYGCPLPKQFDEEGRYTLPTQLWKRIYIYAIFYLQSLRYHIDHNINAGITEIHKFAHSLQINKTKRVPD